MSDPNQDSPVGLGAQVTLLLLDEDGGQEELQVQIVPARNADLTQGLLGENTPLARAIRGKRAGQEIEYAGGDIRTVRILAVTRADLERLEDTALRREEALRRAQSAVNRASAQSFAASYSSKWGDYDPSGLEEDPS